MKNLFIVLFLLSICTNCLSQTPAEIYEYLNEKIDIYKLNDTEKNYNYIVEEVDVNQNKRINFIQFCTTFKLCSRAYLLNPREYTGIAVKEKSEGILIELSFKSNSITTEKININTEEHFKGDSASKVSIILGNDTPESEVNKIKKGFIKLFRMYDVE